MPSDIAIAIIKDKGSKGKLDRSAFIYMDPRGKKEDEFAQCGTCIMFTGDFIKKGEKDGKCTIMGDIPIKAIGSCTLYVPGPNSVGAETAKYSNPKEAGYVERPVRCENCSYYEKSMSTCKLFHRLNMEQPEDWELDEHVHPLGCCNAQMPRY